MSILNLPDRELADLCDWFLSMDDVELGRTASYSFCHEKQKELMRDLKRIATAAKRYALRQAYERLIGDS